MIAQHLTDQQPTQLALAGKASEQPARIWPWATAVAVLVFSTIALIESRVLLADSYMELYAGRLIANHGLPHTDTLTLAGHGRPWVDQQWLAHLTSYELWRVGGYPAVGAFSAIMIAISFAILTDCLIRRGASPMRALTWTVVAFFVCQTNTIIRAQSIAYPLFAALLWLLLDDRTRARPGWRLALIPVIVAVYANVHGSVLLAVGMVGVACLVRGAEAVYRRDWGLLHRYLALGVVSGLAILATPYPPGELVSYYGSVLGNPVIAQNVTEWWPATFGGVSTEFVISLGLLIGILGFALGRGFRPDPFLTIIAFGFAFAGTTAVRYQVWFAFPMAILIADSLNVTVKAPSNRPATTSATRLPAMLGGLALGLLCASAALSFTGQSTVREQVWLGFAGLIAGCDALYRLQGSGYSWLRRGFPLAVSLVAVAAGVSLAIASTAQFERLTPAKAVAAAATYADQHPGARILADDVSAPPLLWLHPELQGRVAFDARLEIYDQRTLRGYTDFVSATVDRWDRIIPNYNVLVVSRTLNPILAKKVSWRAGWTSIESDSRGLALARRP